MIRRTLGLCAAVVSIGALSLPALATSDYFIYANFGVSGYGVDTYQVDATSGYAFVQYQSSVKVYKITISDGDADGIINYHQHPDNPASLGKPMEPRTNSLVGTYTAAPGTHSECEFFADNGLIYMGADNGIYSASWNTATGAITSGWTQVGPALGNSGTWDTQTLAYDKANQTFYAGRGDGGYNQRMYSLTDADSDGWMDESWTYEFTAMVTSTGGHHDGLEYVNGKLWVSEMYSDYLMMYQKTGSGWQLYDKDGDGIYNEIDDAFSYPGSGSSLAVEGMGYGLFDHFWINSGSALYEVGGGLVQQQLGVIPEPLTMLAVAAGLGFVGGYVRKRRR